MNKVMDCFAKILTSLSKSNVIIKLSIPLVPVDVYEVLIKNSSLSFIPLSWAIFYSF